MIDAYEKWFAGTILRAIRSILFLDEYFNSKNKITRKHKYIAGVGRFRNGLPQPCILAKEYDINTAAETITKVIQSIDPIFYGARQINYPKWLTGDLLPITTSSREL